MAKRGTKQALVMSALSLLLCAAMLIGTTFAWFTDSVTSTGNKIQSGTLKVDLELLDKETGWKSVKADNDPIFDYQKWEPGYTDVKILKVENEGTLALKWKAKFIAEKELSALANVIDVYVNPSQTELSYPADRDLTDYVKVGTVAEFVNTIEITTTGTLDEHGVAYLGIALKMRESAGNEYQGLDLGGAIDIMILATQNTVEEDSFDEMYDELSEYQSVPVKVNNLTNLKQALSNGDSVQLTNDIATDATLELNGGVFDGNDNSISYPGVEYTPVFDLTGGTIKNLEITGDGPWGVKYAIGSNQYASTKLDEDLFVENVDVSRIKFSVDLDANGSSVYIKDSELCNSIQIANADETVFENCHFYKDDGEYSATSNIFILGSMTFINCHFEESVNFYLDSNAFNGTLKFINCTYGNNGVQDRPFEPTVGFFTWWMNSAYFPTFSDGKPARTNFTCIVDDTVVW